MLRENQSHHDQHIYKLVMSINNFFLFYNQFFFSDFKNRGVMIFVWFGSQV